ncbi:DUF2846 domain-containing protein [Entomomonas sp. E2T0]|uniref:DUF2846 domain-containing protein n=1 Tax=Entomomonas sp. E2T0 TaxID=2930213 RepID=UPI0022283E55|nr:DUF2846 domain-containing protein [Entomomonas sp. E2T0]UYZ85445.1 DUF2846 domain-containing protein [Entomomonas sp. E2T0]
MRLIPILLLSLLLAACYTPVSVTQMLQDTESYQLPHLIKADQGMVYVVRPNSLYTIFKYNVFLDGKEANSQVGYNRGNQYIYFHVEPGEHTVASKAENWGEVSFTIKAGETIYIIQDASFGFLFGRNSVYKINPVEAKYYIKHSELGTLNRTVE